MLSADAASGRNEAVIYILTVHSICDIRHTNSFGADSIAKSDCRRVRDAENGWRKARRTSEMPMSSRPTKAHEYFIRRRVEPEDLATGYGREVQTG